MTETFSTIAHNASEAARPHLWQGLTGAWVPSLGVTGGTLRDVSGRKYHGTLTSMDPATDWQVSGGGWCLDFDGVNDYVSVGSHQWSATPNTISLWVRPSATGANQFLFDGSTSPSFGNGVSIRIMNTSSVRYWSYNANYSVTTTATVSAGNWYHLAGSFDGGTSRVFINGVLAGLTAGDSVSSVTGPYRIGSSQTLGGPTNGKIDDVRFYQRALSPAEIKTLATRRGMGLERKRRRVYSIAAAPVVYGQRLSRHRTILGGGLR